MADPRERDVILLVEDSVADRELTIRELRVNGITNTLVVAESGGEALDYLFGTGRYAGRNTSVQPLVMLLDLHMPGIDGTEVLRRVRADLRTKTLPVIVLTGSTEEADLMRSYALAAKFAQKPLTFSWLHTALRKLGLLARLHTAAMLVAAFS